MHEIVIIMGYPGAGKTTLTTDFISKGYTRFNRDEQGCSIEQLHKKVDLDLTASPKSIVLDNTYPTKESRSAIIKIGQAHGIPVRLIHLNTSIEDAQFNICQRMFTKYGKLVELEDMKGYKDFSLVPAQALFHYRKVFEGPTMAEGFSAVETIEFKRNITPTSNKGIIFDYDGTLRTTISGAKYPLTKADIKILPNRTEILRDLLNKGIKLFGVSNQSAVSKGLITLDEVRGLFDHTNQLLGLSPTEIETNFCPHSPVPISCYCRKPMPGLGVQFLLKYQLDISQVLMVGDLKTDASFARRCNIKFVHADEFFAAPQTYIT